MKKIVSLVLLLSIMLIMRPTIIFAVDSERSGTCGVDGDNLSWSLSDDGVLTISGTGKLAGYSYEGWTPVRPPWHAYSSSITEVVIEDGVTDVSGEPFYGYKNLTTVTMPDSVTAIDSGVFAHSGLTGIAISKNVTSLSGYAFADCPNLERIDADNDNPNCVSEDGVLFDKQKNKLISYAGNSTTYYVPNTVTVIDEFAFWGRGSLVYLYIPDSVFRIYVNALRDCSSIKCIVMGIGLCEIWSNIFSGCSKLSDIYYAGTNDSWNAIRLNCGGSSQLSDSVAIGI